MRLREIYIIDEVHKLLFYLDGDSEEQYVVSFEYAQRAWRCTCGDYKMRKRLTGGSCKHIEFVIDWWRGVLERMAGEEKKEAVI